MSTTWRWGKKKSDEIRERIGSLQPSQPSATQTQSDFQLSDKHKQELLDIVEGRDTFSYDAQSDPMYQQYREQYRRNARGAAEDVYANATARSGGFGNSYANVAAQQTYNAQMEGVTDIIPELEALAYGRHQTQQEQKLTAYDQLQALYDADHEELLSRMYLYAYNGTQEGLWDGASGAKEALRAKFPEMTDDDFATIKAEMYDGGYWSGAEKSGAPSGGYTAEDGTEISQEEVDEDYNWLDKAEAGNFSLAERKKVVADHDQGIISDDTFAEVQKEYSKHIFTNENAFLDESGNRVDYDEAEDLLEEALADPLLTESAKIELKSSYRKLYVGKPIGALNEDINVFTNDMSVVGNHFTIRTRITGLSSIVNVYSGGEVDDDFIRNSAKSIDDGGVFEMDGKIYLCHKGGIYLVQGGILEFMDPLHSRLHYSDLADEYL